MNNNLITVYYISNTEIFLRNTISISIKKETNYTNQLICDNIHSNIIDACVELYDILKDMDDDTSIIPRNKSNKYDNNLSNILKDINKDDIDDLQILLDYINEYNFIDSFSYNGLDENISTYYLTKSIISKNNDNYEIISSKNINDIYNHIHDFNNFDLIKTNKLYQHIKFINNNNCEYEIGSNILFVIKEPINKYHMINVI
jgi:hypothetical protein